MSGLHLGIFAGLVAGFVALGYQHIQLEHRVEALEFHGAVFTLYTVPSMEFRAGGCSGSNFYGGDDRSAYGGADGCSTGGRW